MLAGLVSASSDAMLVTDFRGRILLWNPAAEKLLGYSAEQVLGRTMDFIVPDAMRGEHTAGMSRLREGGAPRLIGKPVEVPALRSDGTTVPIEMCLSTWRDGEMYFGAVIREISARKENDALLHSLAHYDQLTMLPNRNRFVASLVELVSGDISAATVLIANFDRFADVNDRLGDVEADDLLREAALCLKRFVRRERLRDAPVGRIGSNEFAVCLSGSSDLAGAGERLKEELAAIKGSDGRQLTVSIGVANWPGHGTTAGKLLANADFAMRRAKIEGGDRWRLFQPHQREVVRAKRDLEQTLLAAWETGQFEVHYQPQVRLSDRAIIGAEALLRWRSPTQGLILPGLFMHAMQASELALLVGDFVVEDACRQAAAWRDIAGRPIRVAVNLFEKQFLRPDMPERVERALATAGLEPESLEVEIIETVITGSDEASIRRVKRLRDIGVGIAFDDYGTGYASLGLLKRYPITTLKIDRAFVQEVNRDRNDRTIVELVLTLGTRFGFNVIAEGVETQDQAEILNALGCPEAQGYLFGRPAPAEALSAALSAPEQKTTSRALVA
ncbi:GGDEF domain-containing phosphodiesterase [Methylopila sp. M107]|uniref:putative bifunctional diguanylate cyclase/phosphodiesterase n=1 Tax=Methylopila sp. M107 TaxID=1101190 RepID=UPI00037C8C66|nr:GGDEF domain-containing phosphodiesterase [Methylopila sp. M107]